MHGLKYKSRWAKLVECTALSPSTLTILLASNFLYCTLKRQENEITDKSILPRISQQLCSSSMLLYDIFI